MADDKKVLPFPVKASPIPGFDEAGNPTIILGMIHGVQCFHRAKMVGVQLFSSKEKAETAKENLTKHAASHISTRHEWTFRVEDYPVY